jgi:tetratricopeptide (TPR) repeat protein
MPNLTEIKEFNQILSALGSEPEILAEKGTEIEEIAPPEQELSEDLKELLETPAAKAPAGAPAEPEAEEGALDFESLFGDEQESLEGLDELPLNYQEEASREAPPEEAVVEPPPEEGPFEAPAEEEEAVPPFEAEIPAEEEVPAEEGGDEEFALELPPLEMEEGEEVAEEGLPPLEEALPELEIPAGEEGIGPLEEQISEEEAAGIEIQAPGEMDLQVPGEEIEEEIELPSFEELPEDEPPGEELPEEALPSDELIEPEIPEEVIQLPEEGEMELPAPEDFQIPEGEEELPPLEEIGAEAELPAEPAPGEEVPEALPDMESAGEFDSLEEPIGDEFSIDEFALPGVEEAADETFGEEAVEREEAFEEQKAEVREEEAVPPIGPFVEEEIEFSPVKVEAIQNTLSGLPLNVKIPVEELIGGDTLTSQDLHKLLNMLIQGNSPTEIAAFASVLTGKTIQLPKRYEKTTGIEFELERRTFAYNFRENILPILKVFIPTLIIAVLLGIAVNRFVVIPIRANSVYKRGHDLIETGHYEEANETFKTAVGIQPMKRWFFRYADKFTDKKQYQEAADKYEDLGERYGLIKQAALDYAFLESHYRGQYSKAEKLLDSFLVKENFDYEALLASGDNYMKWAVTEPERYENAYLAYSRILTTKNRGKDEPWLRLLHFFIQTDKLEEVLNLKNRFQASKNVEVDPVIYTELGGYLIEKDKLDDVRDILNQAMDVKEDLPEIHYNFSRYFKAIGDSVNEEEALVYTEKYLNEAEKSYPLTVERLKILIQTHNRLGEIYAAREQPVKAEASFIDAIKQIEEGQEIGILPKTAEFGKVYYNRGDIYYNHLQPDLYMAGDMYEKALENGYNEPELHFKIGYIQYAAENYSDALEELYGVRSTYNGNQNYLFALANTFFQKENYFAAQGYYSRLLDFLEEKKDRIPIIRPEEFPEHRELIELLMKTHNNLGVTLAHLARTPLDPEKETQALVNFIQSSEYFDVLARDPETLVKGESRSRAELNARQIQYPQQNYILQIYKRIPKETSVSGF